MRIGMFADMYKPHTSGVTNHIALCRAHLEELGHETFVFTFGNRDFADDEPRVVRSPAVAWGDTGWQLGLSLSAEARSLVRGLDVAHVHHPFVSGRLALKECEPRSIPVVFTNHTRYDIYSDAYARYVPRPARMAYLRSYLRWFADKVDVVIAPSEGIVEWLRSFGVTDEAVHVPNGIDTRPFAHPAQPATRADLGLEPDDVVACYLGRLGPEKNLDMLVEAFTIAAGAVPELAVYLIGDGPGRHAAERGLESAGLGGRAVFAGLVPYAEVPDRLAACDFLVTASVSEVHPLTILEGMAAGLPCVGVDSPGVGDTVEDGVTGFLVTEDANELAERIALVAGDAALRERFSEAARAAAALCDVSVTVPRLLALYEGLLAAR